MPLSEENDGILSEFRGLDFARSQSRGRQTNGKILRIALIAEAALKKFDVSAGGAREIVSQNWDLIVPEKYANECVPAFVKNGVLTIKADNAPLKQYLIFEQNGILKKLQSFPECAEIKKVRII